MFSPSRRLRLDRKDVTGSADDAAELTDGTTMIVTLRGQKGAPQLLGLSGGGLLATAALDSEAMITMAMMMKCFESILVMGELSICSGVFLFVGESSAEEETVEVLVPKFVVWMQEGSQRYLVVVDGQCIWELWSVMSHSCSGCSMISPTHFRRGSMFEPDVSSLHHM